MTFFRPSPVWIDWLIKRAAGRPLVDAGCGEGHLLLSLQEAGYNRIIGIDPFIDETVYLELVTRNIHVLPFPAEDSLLTAHGGQLWIFARPCHSDFVMRTLCKLHPENEVLYVSRPDNLKVDIKPPFRAIEQGAPPCPEEMTYQIVRSPVSSPSSGNAKPNTREKSRTKPTWSAALSTEPT